MGKRETAWMPECDERPRRGGWAPGRYLNRCSSCGVEFVGDKRAVTCAPCAYIDVTILDAQREEAALPTLRTYDPSRERVVPLDASPSDVVVLEPRLVQRAANELELWAEHQMKHERLRAFGRDARRATEDTVARLRSALDGEG